MSAAKKARSYHILVGKYGNKDAAYEMLFGDYDKSVVQYEKEVTNDYVGLRVITLTEDNNAAVMHAVRSLNS